MLNYILSVGVIGYAPTLFYTLHISLFFKLYLSLSLCLFYAPYALSLTLFPSLFYDLSLSLLRSVSLIFKLILCSY